MIGELKPYNKMKASGSPWIMQIPAHWEVHNFRTMIGSRNERNRPDLPLLSVAREKGVFVRSMTDPNENHNVIPEDLTNYKVARAGNLVINKMKAWQGSMGVAPCDGIVSPAYYVYEFRIENKRYGQMLLRSKPYVAHFGQASDGVRVGQWDLSITRMRQIPVLVPPAEEQEAIVRFLTWANSKIERAIRAKRKVIALLNEQKQAIIHKAVTRGLNPSVELRPSGIAWLGDIPEHWQALNLGYVVNLLTGFPFQSSGFTDSTYGIRLLRGLNVTPNGVRWDHAVRWLRHRGDGLDNFQLKPGDIVLGMDRPIISSGVRVATIGESDAPSLLLQRVARLRTTEKLEASYLLLLLKGRSFSQYMAPIFSGISVPHLSPEQIKKFKIALPPIEEQRSIVAQIREETAAIEHATQRLANEIRLIQELKTALEFDVVSGKLDVRNASTETEKSLNGFEPPTDKDEEYEESIEGQTL